MQEITFTIIDIDQITGVRRQVYKSAKNSNVSFGADSAVASSLRANIITNGRFKLSDIVSLTESITSFIVATDNANRSDVKFNVVIPAESENSVEYSCSQFSMVGMDGFDVSKDILFKDFTYTGEPPIINIYVTTKLVQYEQILSPILSYAFVVPDIRSEWSPSANSGNGAVVVRALGNLVSGGISSGDVESYYFSYSIFDNESIVSSQSGPLAANDVRVINVPLGQTALIMNKVIMNDGATAATLIVVHAYPVGDSYYNISAPFTGTDGIGPSTVQGNSVSISIPEGVNTGIGTSHNKRWVCYDGAEEVQVGVGDELNSEITLDNIVFNIGLNPSEWGGIPSGIDLMAGMIFEIRRI